MQNLTRTSHALQAMVMQVRMIPVEAVFLRFPRLVRDLSTKLGKQVELELVGKDTELDRTVVDALGDPLVHLVRNSLDHGLEAPGGARRGRQARRPARSRSPPATPAATSSSRCATTAAASTRARVARKAAERGLIARRRGRLDRHGARAVELLFPPASRPPRSPATSPAAASAWTPSARRSASSAARSLLTSELGQGTTRADPPAADAGDHGRAARRGRRRARSRSRSTASSAPSASPTTLSARSPARRMLVMRDGVLPIVDAAERYGGRRRRSADVRASIVRGAERRARLRVTT